MTDVTNQSAPGAAEIAALQARVMVLKQTMTWEDIGALLGVPHGTLSTWAPGNYTGNNAGVAQRVRRGFMAIDEQKTMELTLPAAPRLQETSATRAVFSALTLAQMGDMAAIASRPGTTKTTSCQEYAATRGKVTLATASPSSSGVPTALLTILAAMGERDVKGTPQVLSSMIRRKVGPGSLIIIDEAQHLSPKALEELRSIHDATGCGLALVGDENLIALLRAHAQLFSRIGLRVTRLEPKAADVAAVAAAWGITDDATVKFLAEVARKPGAFRAVTKTLRLATMGAEGGKPTLAEIREAYAQNYEHAA